MTSASSSFLRRDRRVVAEARRGRALESMDDSDSSSLLGQPFSGGSADMIDKRQKEKRNEEPKNYSLTNGDENDEGDGDDEFCMYKKEGLGVNIRGC